MKKIINILCIALLSMCIVACDNNDKKEEPLVVNSHCSTMGYKDSTSNIVENENGYYISPRAEVHKSIANKYHISFIDKKTNTITPVCSKINCNHNNKQVPEDCEAYIGEMLSGSMKYYDGYIYYIEYSQGDYGCILWRMSSNGSEHEKVCELGNAPMNSAEYFNYVITDSYVIYTSGLADVSKRPEQKNYAEIILYDLKTKSKCSLYNYEDMFAIIRDLRVTNDSLYFMQRNIDGIFESKLYRLKFSDRTVELVDEKICSYTLENEDKLAYWKSYDGIYEYNTATGEKQCIMVSDDETMLGIVVYSNEHLYLDNRKNAGYNKSSIASIGILIDGKMEAKIPINGKMEAKTDTDGEVFTTTEFVGTDRILFASLVYGGLYYSYRLLDDEKINEELVVTELKH